MVKKRTGEQEENRRRREAETLTPVFSATAVKVP
jgi:hypothetical protein